MIARIRGKLELKLPTYAVIDVGGVGYGLNIPLSTYVELGEANSIQELHTYLYVREDAIHLYGFASVEEKALFKLLISVSGVGPRMALGILSGLSVKEFGQAVNNEDVSLLMSIPGIGKKKGQRLLLELKDMIGTVLPESVKGETWADTAEGRVVRDAMSALLSLGCKQEEAKRAIREASKKIPESSNVEELIKESLKHL